MSQDQRERADDRRTDTPPRPKKADERKGRDGERQIDDNQDDLGRDVNDPSRVSNEINRTGH